MSSLQHTQAPSGDDQAGPFVRQTQLRHQLAPYYAALRAIPHRRALLKSPLYAEIAPQLEAMMGAVERGDIRHISRGPGQRLLRVAAWNIQRGRNFTGVRRALCEDPLLREADVLLLSEVDNGLARSGNRNVARELAETLHMNYAFGVSYLTLEDDFGENTEARENTLALAGSAILSRVPLGQVTCVDLPELRDKFSASEKRLGKKRALCAELRLPEGPMVVAQCHLDSNASPAGRRDQLAALLAHLEATAASTGATRLLGGGDLNTTTYDASATLPLLRDLLHKLLVTGFRNTVDGYMTPERRYEAPLFSALRSHGFTVDEFNDRQHGTMEYDLNSAYAINKTQRKVGRLLTAWLRRLLRPWGGVVPARLDWFFGRGVTPLSAAVVFPRDPDNEMMPVSDHAAIVVDLARGPNISG